MCGILAILEASGEVNEKRKRALACVSKLRHRGPDWSGTYVQGRNIFCHERLSIVDVEHGAQPLLNKDKTVVLVVNGEIYNHKELEKGLTKPHQFLTSSDCEVILYLYEEEGDNFLDKIQGDFAFVVSNGTDFLAARDPIGVCPLFIGYGSDGSTWFASELKALQDDCERFETVPPGYYYTSKTRKFEPYYKPAYYRDIVPSEPVNYVKLRESFELSVKRRLMCDVPYGVLLSGGLDSSLVAAVASRFAEKRTEDELKTRAWWPRLHSFCIGVTKNSPDMIAAREVAKFLNTVHHEFEFTVQEGLDALEHVIYHIESFDVTTVRASTPMFLLARRVKAVGVKMVLSGEGSDEIFGGYLYFHQAPDAKSFYEETARRVKLLHTSDCLRANKSTAAWGVEVRVPFLDKDFLDVSMGIDPKDKMCPEGKIEKYILRKAFDDPTNPYLPHSILWRQKEQFSDGVGYSWIDTLKETAEKEISDADFARRAELFPEETPDTKEGIFYRKIFDKLFPHPSARQSVKRWTPTWGKSKDPSGRAQKNHVDAKKELLQ